MTTVLICDDRPSVREGLTRVMSTVPGVNRIDRVAHADELLAQYSRRPADIVLVGTHRPLLSGVTAPGLLAARRLSSAAPRAHVLVFGAVDDTDNITATVAIGAIGYVHWDASQPELIAALAHVLTITSVARSLSLTKRELQVLTWMSQGKSNGQIGRRLRLSEETVKTHARHLYRKLGVRHRAHAVAYGLRHNLVP